MLRHSDGEQRRRDAKSKFLFSGEIAPVQFRVGLRYEREICSFDEHSATIRPEPQPERGYAFSGADVHRLTLYSLRPASKDTLA